MATSSAPGLQLGNTRSTFTVDMSTGATGLSDAISLGGHSLSLIQTSTAWTAAALTFQGSLDGTNYYDVYSSTGGEVAVVTTASKITQIDPALFAGMSKIKIRSGTSTAAVAQAAVRTLMLGLIPLS